MLSFLAVSQIAYSYDYRYKTFYFDNTNTGWTNVYLGFAKNDWSEFNRTMNLVPGTDNLYYYYLGDEWSSGECYFFNDLGWDGEGNTFCHRAAYFGDDHVHSTFTYNQAFTDNTIETAGPDTDGSGSSCGSKDLYEKHSAKPSTYTVTISSPTGGGISVTYKSWDYSNRTGSDQTITSGSFTVVPTCYITVTATPSTGYALASLTIGDDTYYTSPVSNYIVRDDINITAVFESACSSPGTNTVNNDAAVGGVCSGADVNVTLVSPKVGFSYKLYENNEEVPGSQYDCTVAGNKTWAVNPTTAPTTEYKVFGWDSTCSESFGDDVGSTDVDVLGDMVLTASAAEVTPYQPITLTVTGTSISNIHWTIPEGTAIYGVSSKLPTANANPAIFKAPYNASAYVVTVSATDGECVGAIKNVSITVNADSEVCP